MNSLHREIKSGNLEKVKSFLDKNTLQQDCQWTDYNLLRSAIRFGNIEIAKLLIEKGFRVNRKSNVFCEDTPLHLAILQNESDLIELLLENNASLEYRNKNKDTPVTLAAKLHKDAIVNSFLPKISYKNYSNSEGLSHMHIACMKNQVDIVKKFLQNGVHINHQVGSKSNEWGEYTPLHFAVEFQCLETVKFLLYHGASIIRSDSRDRTPLHLAFQLRNEDIVNEILSYHLYESENPNDSQNLSHFHIACTRNNSKVVESFLQFKTVISVNKLFQAVSNDSPCWAGYTALYFAVENECLDVVKLLLKCDINIGTNSSNNLSPSISLAYETGNTDIIDLILSRCEKKLGSKYQKQSTNNTQFFAACMNDSCEILNNFISFVEVNQVINQDSSSWPGWTALHIAVKHKNVDVIEFLLRYEADVNVKNSEEKTPLHLAFEDNQVQIVDILFNNFENLKDNPADLQGLSHFHILCTSNNLKAIKHFLNLGVNINASVSCDSTFWPGYTPLHFAIKYNHQEVIKLLLNHGANLTVKNGIGLTPFDQAILYYSEKYDQESYQPEINYSTLTLLLLEHKRRKIESIYNRGFTLLHIACAMNDLSLIDRSLKTDIVNQTTDYDLPIWAGYTPMHFAAYHNNENAVAMLSDFCDISIKNANESTPLHLNWKYHGTFSPFMIQKYLIWCQENPIGPDGISHFHIACARDYLLAFEFFSKFVDINQPTNFDREINSIPGSTPLHLASSRAIVQMLLEAGANIEARDAHLQTPMHTCFLNRDRTKVDLLAEAGADVNAFDEFRRTPLIVATQNLEAIEIQVIVALLENGADINIESRNGETAMTIDIFTFDDYPEIMTVLMKHIKKLRVLGCYLSDKIEFVYKAESRNLETDGYYNEDDFARQCEEELQYLDNIHIDQYTTMKDIIIKHSNEMYRHVNNKTFTSLIDSPDFKRKFPIYGYLSKLQVRSGLRRQALLEPAKKSLNILAQRELYSVCLERILIYLNDHDLKNIADSVK